MEESREIGDRVTDPRERARMVRALVGLPEETPLVRASGGQTNEVWFCGPYLFRIRPGPEEPALRLEAELLPLLPQSLPTAPVIAYGRAEQFSWLVQQRLPGKPLVLHWPDMPVDQRRAAVRELARHLRRLHSLADGAVGGLAALRERPFSGPPSRWVEGALGHLRTQLEQAMELPRVDRGLMGQAAAMMEQASRAFGADDPVGLVHNDLHFDNILWRDGITAILDFGRTCHGPVDLELDIFLRFCRFPHLFVARKAEPLARPELYEPVPHWLAEEYPDLFAHPCLADRLAFFSLAYDLKQLLKYPPDRSPDELGGHHPYNRIRATVRGR